MTSYYKVALLLVAVLILATFVLMQRALHIQEVKIRLNALTSDQSRLFTDIGAMTRTLMQEAVGGHMPENSLDELRARIKQKTTRIRDNMAEILATDEDRFMGLFEGGIVLRFYRQPPFSLERKLDMFLHRADDIAGLETSRLRDRQRQWSPIDIVVSSVTLMQRDFDEAMLKSFEVSQRNVESVRLVEVCLSAAALVLLGLEWIFIFAPLVRRLRREHEQTLRQQIELEHQSRRDGLTGLHNRMSFQGELAREIDESRSAGRPVGLILFDLDHFKPINDSLGHQAGDAILKAVAERVRAAAGPETFVARLGGDEFAVLPCLGDGSETLVELIGRLKPEVERTIVYASHDIEPAVSFGAAVLPTGSSRDGDWLFGAADAALYRAKQDRRGSVLFDDAMRAEMETEHQLALGLKRALAAQELDVFYQPQVRLADRRVVGFEALVRWHHPERGLLAPGVFLPAAERCGLMTELTVFVVWRVAADIARWIGMGREPGIVAINMPEAMLATALARQTIDQAMARHGLSVARLGIEVTENVLLNRNTTLIIETLRAMRIRGVRVSFDDFGTGYASMSHLRSFPLDEIKIDRSFVRDVLVDGSSAEIVRSLIRLAGKLKKTAVAEGIETADQLAFMLEEGCPIGQGYLFSPPVPFEDASAMIGQRQPLPPGPTVTNEAFRLEPLRERAGV